MKMGYQKAFENKYQDLDTNTKYRFAEMEIARTVYQLTPVFRNSLGPRDYTIGIIWDAICPKQMNIDTYYNEFKQIINNHMINNPSAEMRVKYFIIHGQSYKKIRDLTGTAFNTIAAARFGLPYYVPLFQHWNEEMLLNWNQLSKSFNIWGEKLTHYKN